MAISVASGAPCLGRFKVHSPGPVLYYAAQDPPEAMRVRGENLATARKLDFNRIPLGLITEPGLRLDAPIHQRRLVLTLAETRPRLLVLDPLVRLHSADENSSAQVANLLGFLRNLQREQAVAILLVHHARKSGAAQPGQALSGSGDIHAWGDSNLYLLSQENGPVLHVEHRSHPSPPDMAIRLLKDPAHLEVNATPAQSKSNPLENRILDALSRHPMSRTALRDVLQIRNESLGVALEALEAAGRITREGHVLAVSVPARMAGTERRNEP